MKILQARLRGCQLRKAGIRGPGGVDGLHACHRDLGHQVLVVLGRVERGRVAGCLRGLNLFAPELLEMLFLSNLEVLFDAEVALRIGRVEVLELLDKVLGDDAVSVGKRLHRLVERRRRAVLIDD
jgi:hypothetical protein